MNINNTVIKAPDKEFHLHLIESFLTDCLCSPSQVNESSWGSVSHSLNCFLHLSLQQQTVCFAKKDNNNHAQNLKFHEAFASLKRKDSTTAQATIGHQVEKEKGELIYLLSTCNDISHAKSNR